MRKNGQLSCFMSFSFPLITLGYIPDKLLEIGKRNLDMQLAVGEGVKVGKSASSFPFLLITKLSWKFVSFLINDSQKFSC